MFELKIFIIVALFIRGGMLCAMPREIPADMKQYYNQTAWDALRNRQIEQMERNGGCPDTQEAPDCHIQDMAMFTLQGECRIVQGKYPMCVIFDKKHYRHTTAWPNHPTCRSMSTRSRRVKRLPRRRDVTRLERKNARIRAENGLFPSNVDSEGNQRPKRICYVHQEKPFEIGGHCTLLPDGVYGCQAGKKFIFFDSACAHLRDSTGDL